MTATDISNAMAVSIPGPTATRQTAHRKLSNRTGQAR